MFDTSIVRARTIASSRGATFLVSVALHSIAVVAAVTLTLATTALPSHPPRQLGLYRPVDLPAMPPPPLGRPAPAHAQQAVPPSSKPQVPVQITAPAVIPEAPASIATSTASSGGSQTGESPAGDPNGVIDGLGGNPASTGAGALVPYVPGGEVISAHVISRVEPRFPPSLTHAVRSAVVVVRCVIGKDGQIRDPEIVTSSFPPFNDSVLAALRQWKFSPGTMRGSAVDTWFELTVRFQVR